MKPAADQAAGSPSSPRPLDQLDCPKQTNDREAEIEETFDDSLSHRLLLFNYESARRKAGRFCHQLGFSGRRQARNAVLPAIPNNISANSSISTYDGCRRVRVCQPNAATTSSPKQIRCGFGWSFAIEATRLLHGCFRAPFAGLRRAYGQPFLDQRHERSFGQRPGHSLPAFTLLGLAAEPGPPRHFELEPRFPGLVRLVPVLDARAADLAAVHRGPRYVPATMQVR